MRVERLSHVPWDDLDVEAVLPAITTILRGTAAERVLERLLRSHPDWMAAQRRAAAEAVFGVALWRRRLAWHAGLSLPDLLVEPDARVYGDETAFSALDVAGALLASLLRDLAGAPVPPSLDVDANWRRGEPEKLADRWSLPDWLEQHLRAELGTAEAERFCAAISGPGPITLRANRALCTRDQLAQELHAEHIDTRRCDRAPDALRVSSPQPNLFGCRAFRDGLFEVQDEGSQLVGLLIGPHPGETVLDLCAGAGGKSLLLAAQGAHVFAFDVDQERLVRLRSRSRRARVADRVTIVPAPVAADAVLVDAPCSEIGTLRRGPDMRWRIDRASLRTFPGAQRGLLETAAPLARRRLVYATCTIHRAENEDLAAAFGSTHPELRRTATLVTSPHHDGTDGFFAAVWDRA
jgi:16S rRNA (cytosine967-C5)-methyltransferase